MAQQRIVLLADDIDDTEATATVRFGIDGTEYEIDLNPDHERELREIYAPFVAKARRIKGNGKSPVRVRDGESADVRAWATAHGYPVKERGRINPDIVKAYRNRTRTPVDAIQPGEPPYTPDGSGMDAVNAVTLAPAPQSPAEPPAEPPAPVGRVRRKRPAEPRSDPAPDGAQSPAEPPAPGPAPTGPAGPPQSPEGAAEPPRTGTATAVIRAWAKLNGFKVNATGKLPESVVQAYANRSV
jgi:Lsr2